MKKEDLKNLILGIYERGDYILAIKVYKSITKKSLKECKQYVDKIRVL